MPFFNLNHMKMRLIRLIVDACKYIEYKRGNLSDYEYENAPYCCRKYGKAKGIYRAEYFDDGGYEEASFLGFVFGIDTDDDCWWVLVV